MPTGRRTRSQAQNDLRALRRLRDLGIISAKTDLRKTPSKRTRTLINKIKPVLEGKASAVKPADPSAYKSGFSVLKDVVIVPRKKGERIAVSKTGKITKTRREGNRRIKSTIRTGQPAAIERPAANKVIIFKVPFKKRGTDQVEYRRFTYDGLKTFFAEYLRNIQQFDEWAQFIEEEEITFANREAADAWEDAHSQLITGSVSMREDAEPVKGRKKVRKLRRDLKDELPDE
jgi:hypothetical protein